MSKKLKEKNVMNHLKKRETTQELHSKKTNIFLKVNKSNSINKSKKEDESMSSNQYATDEVISTQKGTSILASRKFRDNMKKKFAKTRGNRKSLKTKAGSNNDKNDASVSIDRFTPTKSESSHIAANRLQKKRDFLQTKSVRVSQAKSVQLEHIKKKMIQQNQARMKLKQSFSTAHKKASTAFKGTLTFFKKSVFTIQRIVSLGVSLVLLLVITLFIGIFAALSGSSTISAPYEPLSTEVLGYQKLVEQYAMEYEMEDYVAIILAVMMQESQGKGTDPMQASLFPYNSKYPQRVDGITDPEYSIKVGIQYLADCFEKANVEDVNDDDHIALALQGYDYGEEYIDWAIHNFDGYTKANAKVYYDEKIAEIGVDSFGDPSYVEHVLRYVQLGFGNLRQEPDFDNLQAWGSNNPYSRAGLYGECTWFAWGRFYEIYGYDPGFTGDGWDCVEQLVAAHPDKFEISDTPAVGAIFSCIGRNHVGIVIGWDGTHIIIQEENLDGKTNSFEDAKKDWHTVTYTLSQFVSISHGVEFAILRE